MNRISEAHYEAASSIPHGCGDEPIPAPGQRMAGIVFPTDVGMNRTIGFRFLYMLRIPHGCGDEP